MPIADKDQMLRVPLHVQIADRLRKEILNRGKPGEKVGSQNELARRFGVSAITVREAVGTLVQAGLLERRHGSGTYIRDTNAGKAIGVLIEQDISCPGTSFYWTRITQQLRLQFEDAGFSTRLYAGHSKVGSPEPSKPTCAEFWQDLKEDRIRGLAIVGTPLNEGWLRELRERRIPFVSTSMNEVLPDSTEAMIREGTRYLVDHGRRHIAVLTWGTPDRPFVEYAAFKKEMAACRIPVRHAWVYQAGLSTHDVFAGMDGFRTIWNADRIKPDGLLICSDRLLHSALSAIHLMEVNVPHDLLIVAHTHRGESNGDLPVPIVRMEVDPDTHAKRLGDHLLGQLTGVPVVLDKSFTPYRLLEPPACPEKDTHA